MQKLEMLQLLKEKVEKCTKCPELAETRTQIIFGDGNPNAKVLLIGEAGGSDEDKQGIPFVGKAGKLLNKIIEAAGWNRKEDVYLLNILKCHPPNNRKPKEKECNNCKPFLELQIKIVNPKIIICLGTTAAQNLLQTNTPISKLRGNWFEYTNAHVKAKVMPTFHPSFLFRQPSAKKDVWEDFKKVIAEIKSV
jgi:DNA polymerase